MLFEIDAALHAAVVETGQATGCSPFMVVHAALAALLARLSSTTDIAIGTPVAGRGEQALDNLIGMFVNTLVLRAPSHRATRSPRCSTESAPAISMRSRTRNCPSSGW